MAFWLLHVDVFLDVRPQEGGLDICLFHRPIEASGQADNDADCNKFCCWGESLFVIDPFDLSESARDESGLVLDDVAFCVLFCLVDPFVGDDICMRWTRDQVPDLSVCERLDFFKFCPSPFFREG